MPVPKDIRSARPASEKIVLLSNHPLFREFGPEVIEKIASHMTRRTVERGTAIFSKGDTGMGLFGVLDGKVKISLLSANGRELVINMIHVGEIFGEIALLDGGIRTADATAISDCQLMVLDRRDFVPFLRSEPDIALKFIEILCGRLRRTSDQLEDSVFLTLPGRLAKALLQLAGPSGASGEARKIFITQRDIGQIIGTSRESTNKQLRAWAERGWLRLERSAVTILKPDAIAEVAEDFESELR